MRQRIVEWIELACERLDERICALANLTDEGDDEPVALSLSESLGNRLA
jgi:hypothetical protein